VIDDEDLLLASMLTRLLRAFSADVYTGVNEPRAATDSIRKKSVVISM